jgi:hypothetical protein
MSAKFRHPIPEVEALAKVIYESWWRKLSEKTIETSAFGFEDVLPNRSWEDASEVQAERAYVQAEAALKWLAEYDPRL